jgi:hypothetical protein
VNAPAATARGRLTALLCFVGPMWIVRLLDALTPGMISAAGTGIVPRTWSGLHGVLVAPFIHSSFEHLIANSIPLVILGVLILVRGVAEFVFVVLVSGLVGGLGTWLFGTGHRSTSARAVSSSASSAISSFERRSTGASPPRSSRCWSPPSTVRPWRGRWSRSRRSPGVATSSASSAAFSPHGCGTRRVECAVTLLDDSGVLEWGTPARTLRVSR